jgi:integrase
MKVRLTARFCSAAKSAAAQTDYFDETVPGLALRVSGTTKAWSLLYSRADGRRARMTLGRYPALSLAGARSAALEAKGAVAEGRPIGTDTFAAVWAEFYRREAPALRSAERRKRLFERLILPTLGERPIGEIRRSEIVALLDRIEDQNGSMTAHLVLAYLSRLFNWHASRTEEFRSPIVKGMARIKPAERARDRVLSVDELRALWPKAGPFVRFLLLTAVRRSEAAGMRWDELDGSLWIIPAARMKGKAEHIVPLSAAALSCIGMGAILSEGQEPVIDRVPMAADGRAAFVFGGSRPLGGLSHIKRRLDEACPLAHWTLHDLRRTARSLMSKAGVNKDIAERCLAHAIGGVRGVYDRHAYLEEKKAAFDALAALIERIVGRRE